MIGNAIQNASRVAANLPAPSVEKTKIITTDSVAMEALAGSIEAANVILTENNVLRRQEHDDRKLMRERLEANTEAIERATAAVNEARQDIRELTREIVRSGK